jgi:hypothetical protein
MNTEYAPLSPAQRKLWDMARSIIKEPYAWPGGYERLLLTSDGGILCSECVRKEARQIYWDVANKCSTGWNPAGTTYEAVSAECARECSPDLVSYCDHCRRVFGEFGC